MSDLLHIPGPRGAAPSVEIRDALFEGFAKVAQALAHPTRLHLLGLLDYAEHPVEKLVEQTGAQFASVSAHLKVLREAGLVRSRREGRRIVYSIAHAEVPSLIHSLRQLSAIALPEIRLLVETHYRDHEVIEGVDAAEKLLAQIQRSRCLVIDLRPHEEFQRAHLPRARSFPLQELGDRLHEIPRDKPVVAYCRGPFCLAALRGVRLLLGAGYQARRLAMSVGDWARAGLPLKT
ncbi:MAG: metalloregulator ArsR/SmtB family transcription factor [Sandaracinaceae bacterium]|nr:metalloregulator ArsR/SmtB family transcription factor [Sandaracinaceae bacterium]